MGSPKIDKLQGFINPSHKQVATNGRASHKKNSWIRRAPRIIDFSKPQPVVCHLFRPRVNNAAENPIFEV